MIVCWRTAQVPVEQRERLLAWIEGNRQLREGHGILFELALERSARESPAQTLQPAEPQPTDDRDVVVVTAWPSHDASMRGSTPPTATA